MARAAALQAAFNAGELTPRLFGRSDIAKYASGAEAIENYIPRPEGGLMRRHGTRFAGQIKTMTAVGRLVPFIFSTAQAYILEFGNLFFRVWKNYGQVTSASNAITGITNASPAVLTYGGADNFANGDKVLISGVVGMTQVNNREFTVANLNAGANTFELSGVNSTGYGVYSSGGTASKVLEVVTPWTTADLPTLVFAQSADTLYVVHGSYAPRKIGRTSDTAWTVSTLNLNKGPFTAVNVDDTKHVFCTVTGSNYDPGDTVTIQSNADIFESGHDGAYFYIEERYFADISVSAWQAATVVTTTIGTQISNAGNVYELVDGGSATSNTGSVPPTHIDGEAWDGHINGGIGHKKWRFLHSRFAIIEITTFTDSKNVTGTIRTRLPNGLAPTARTITNVTNSGGICRVTSAGHAFSTGDYVFIEGVVGATQANGSWRIINAATNTFDLEGSSAPSAYTSGGTAKRYSSYKWRHSAFSAARGYPAAVTLHEQRLCYANTTQEPFGNWLSRSGDYENFLPGTTDSDAIGYLIAAPQVNAVRWLASGDNLIIGTLAQEFAAFGGGLGDPITPTNTRIVPQSSEGSIAAQPEKAEGSVLFINRAGRKVFTLDYDTASNHYQATDLIELAAHLTEGGKTLTRLAWAKNPMSVLWALRSDGVLLSLTYRRDQQVYAWARHPLSDGTVESIAVIPSQDGTTDDLWMIVNRTVNGSTARYVEYLAQPYEPSSATDKTAMGFVDSGLSYSGAAVTAFTGLFHLEAKTVKVLVNGALHPDRTVSNGSITLDASATQAWVGLAYTSRVRTLRPEAGAVGTAMGKTKRASRVTLRVMNAMGGMCGPADESVLETVTHRDLADLMDASFPLRTGDFDVNIASDYDLDGRISVVQSDPLPFDLLAVIPNMTVSET